MAKMASEFRPLTVSLIAAVARNGGIGRDGGLLCPLPADLRRFKQLTVGHPVIMGRRTFESLPKGALPHRRNLVLSRSPGAEFPGAERFGSLREALEACLPSEGAAAGGEKPEVFVIGGHSVYREALPAADRLYLTSVEHDGAGADVFFPDFDPSAWRTVEMEPHEADERNPFSYTFLTLERLP